MLRIVTDSAGDCPSGWPQKYKFDIIPVNIHFGEKKYLQDVDLTEEEFYRLARESGIIPKTSQPTPQQFIDFYRKVAEPGDTILSIHVTSQLSGTYSSAVLAARDLADEFEVIPFDSAAGSAALAFMCMEARELQEAGATTESILTRLEHIRSNLQVMLTLDTLDFARMSGRVKALQAILASALRIKPIIDLQNGVLDATGQVRTRGRSIAKLVETIYERLGDRPINVAIVHAQDPKTAEELGVRVKEIFNCHKFITTNLSIGVAANLGPGTVGIIAYPI